MKHILLVHTGGTLGMTGRRPAALKPGAFFRTLKSRVPELGKLAKLDLHLFSNVDSSELQPESWVQLASYLFERRDDVDGVVVTHGTDTLAWTASALSFLLPSFGKPIVLTGAQRPLGEVRSDARLNLVDAVTSASAGPAEVSVCFDSHLYRGNRVRKASVSEYDAFDSPNFPPLGVLGVDARFEPGLVASGKPQLSAKLDPRVFVLKVYPGLDVELVLSMLDRVKGLVIEAYGAGNFPVGERRSLRPLFREAKARDIPVVVVSQAHRNGVDLSLYESGVVAMEEGAISGGDMTVSAAAVKLMHALATFEAPKARRSYLERSVAGERT